MVLHYNIPLYCMLFYCVLLIAMNGSSSFRVMRQIVATSRCVILSSLPLNMLVVEGEVGNPTYFEELA